PVTAFALTRNKASTVIRVATVLCLLMEGLGRLLRAADATQIPLPFTGKSGRTGSMSEPGALRWL
ncbi:MAG TPA: hypothetical protein VHI52_03915, partial [Verrucomicrobiae bacterium]|nr:hypothetical protein [Verrucomicrobiae bacterium]